MFLYWMQKRWSWRPILKSLNVPIYIPVKYLIEPKHIILLLPYSNVNNNNNNKIILARYSIFKISHFLQSLRSSVQQKLSWKHNRKSIHSKRNYGHLKCVYWCKRLNINILYAFRCLHSIFKLKNLIILFQTTSSLIFRHSKPNKPIKKSSSFIIFKLLYRLKDDP